MNRILGILGKTLPLYFSLVLLAQAAPQALPLRHETDLGDFTGKTFLETVMQRQTGIKALLDDDYVDSYELADWAAVQNALANFDAKVVRKVLGAFGNDRRSLRAFTDQLAGTRFRPNQLLGILRQNYEGRGNVFALEHFFAIASGAGTVVRIDDGNYYYNYGYKSGASADDVKSGRSYGATPKHNANDASDVMYLGELEDFLTAGRGIREFYETMLEVLTRTDVSGYENGRLNTTAQAAMTDFIAIYTAELDRHLMVDLNPRKHPWENDLAETTLVSAYAAATGLLMKDGELTEAPLKDFWSMSDTGSGRSGIGITRADRRKLQKLICDYERENHPELVRAVETLIDGRTSDGDLFRGLMEYLNQTGTQRSVRANARKLTDAFVELLMQVREDADAITESIR